MKKLIFTTICTSIAFCYSAKAQTNLQIFYDFGEDRQNVTTTLEGYYGDKWGDTFPVHTAVISRLPVALISGRIPLLRTSVRT